MPTCEWLQEIRNQHIPLGVWLEPEKICKTYCLFYLPSFLRSPCSIREPNIQTWAIRFFETVVHHLIGLLTFLVKRLFLVPQLFPGFTVLLCLEQEEPGLYATLSNQASCNLPLPVSQMRQKMENHS